MKAEVTPHYAEESYFLEDPFLTMQQHKDVVKIRNQIMKVRTGTIQGDEAKLWDALEAVFRQSTPGNLKFTYAL